MIVANFNLRSTINTATFHSKSRNLVYGIIKFVGFPAPATFDKCSKVINHGPRQVPLDSRHYFTTQFWF